jgi:hypothetical protein
MPFSNINFTLFFREKNFLFLFIFHAKKASFLSTPILIFEQLFCIADKNSYSKIFAIEFSTNFEGQNGRKRCFSQAKFFEVNKKKEKRKCFTIIIENTFSLFRTSFQKHSFNLILLRAQVSFFLSLATFTIH